MLRRGFALLEILLVVSILGMIGGVSIPMYRDFQIRSDLDSSTEQVTQGLARARLLAQAGEQDSAWGFYVPAGVLYKGDSYETRDPNYDETYPMPSTITSTGPTEITYSKQIGAPSQTGSITLTTLNTEQRTILIEVKLESLAVVQNDSIMICHQTGGGGQHTLMVGDSAWPAHQAHGDFYGPCPGSSSSAASSVSSSAVSSVASSSAASSAASSASSAGGTCAGRFTVGSNGTITTNSSLSVAYTVIGSQLTYGAGGPDIDVTAKYKKSPGNSWSNLFGGDEINGNGGQTSTVTGFSNGTTLNTNFRAYYRSRGWLTYDQTYATNDGSGHVRILRDGDTPPSAAAYGGQTSLKTYLQSILDQNGNINIGEHEVLLLAEMGTCTNCASADFQDAVVKLTFGSSTGCQ